MLFSIELAIGGSRLSATTGCTFQFTRWLRKYHDFVTDHRNTEVSEEWVKAEFKNRLTDTVEYSRINADVGWAMVRSLPEARTIEEFQYRSR